MKLPALLLAVILPGTMVFGQSLAELADSAKKKRKKDTPVYTDDDLKRRSPTPSESPASGAAGARPAPTAKGQSGGGESSSGGDEGGQGEGGSSEATDEASWRAERATRLKAITQAEERIAAIQARINTLNNDLNPTNLTDPFRLQTLEAEKAKARQELEEAELELKRARDELADFDEDARKRGVRPGWLREP